MTPLEITQSITATTSAFKDVLGIVKSLATIDDRIKFTSAIAELQEKLLNQQAVCLDELQKRAESLERIDALGKKLLELEDFGRVAKLYKMFSPCVGNVVYALRDPPHDGQEKHWLCPKCFADRKASILQIASKDGRNPMQSRDALVKCPECGFGFLILRSEFIRLIG